jgi:hypothetical protein
MKKYCLSEVNNIRCECHHVIIRRKTLQLTVDIRLLQQPFMELVQGSVRIEYHFIIYISFVLVRPRRVSLVLSTVNTLKLVHEAITCLSWSVLVRIIRIVT